MYLRSIFNIKLFYTLNSNQEKQNNLIFNHLLYYSCF